MKPSAATGTTPVASQRQIVGQTFSGPMPPPSILQGYELILPGAAERILAIVESDTKHEQNIEFAALRAAESQVKRGQIFSFCLVIIAFASCLGALFLGSEVVASVIAGTTIGAVATAFVVGKITDKD